MNSLDRIITLDLTRIRSKIFFSLKITIPSFLLIFLLSYFIYDSNRESHFITNLSVISSSGSAPQLPQGSDNSLLGSLFGVQQAAPRDLTSTILATKDYKDYFIEKYNYAEIFYTYENFDTKSNKVVKNKERQANLENVGKDEIFNFARQVLDKSIKSYNNSSGSRVFESKFYDKEISYELLNNYVNEINFFMKERERNEIETYLAFLDDRLRDETNSYQIKALTGLIDQNLYSLMMLESDESNKFQIIDKAREPKFPIVSSILRDVIFLSFSISIFIFILFFLLHSFFQKASPLSNRK